MIAPYHPHPTVLLNVWFKHLKKQNEIYFNITNKLNTIQFVVTFNINILI